MRTSKRADVMRILVNAMTTTQGPANTLQVNHMTLVMAHVQSCTSLKLISSVKWAQSTRELMPQIHGSGGSTLQTTILLVEDNKIQKIVNERILHKAGYTVLNARDGEEAMHLAREAIPDIILLDMLLPKLGGREVMQALRGSPHIANPGSRVQ